MADPDDGPEVGGLFRLFPLTYRPEDCAIEYALQT
jgi:hypothetical protein